VNLDMESRSRAGSVGTELGDTKPSFLVPDLVVHQAASTPKALAICAGSQRLTYEELDRRSKKLADYLESVGVTPGSVIGLCAERSVDFPIAALAILRAGCAYLPLEPKTPSSRLHVMLKAAQVSVVLTHSSMMEALAGDGRKLLPLDRCAAEIAAANGGGNSSKVLPHQTAEQLAYVIYTSGSTGMPKAVAVGHGSLLNLCQWHNRAFGVTSNDRASQLASIGFDAAVWEIWPYLIAGASVHLVNDEVRTQPEQLRDWMVRERITIGFAPTPLAERMLNLAWPKETVLRFLLTGADTLHQYPPTGLPFALVNNYGPTECTVVATSATVHSEKSASQRPAIGRPIDNVEVYILDSALQPVTEGEVGEIYIGGAGVGKGYLNDPALTEERFISNPFASATGGRLYRTGDMARQLPDGQIAFHGRVDDQVKISGYRIELNEITSAVNRHPAVRESVVVARENGAGERQLVAYVVPVGASPAVFDLRDFLAKQLPEYMLPAKFVRLDSLPIGPRGKVDRNALPAPSDANMLREQISLGPDTATERSVARIVASLLGLKTLGVEENFFYLGGNSLFGTQLIARLREAFNVEVPLLKLFDHPTVADLSAEVERLMVTRLEAMTEEEAERLLALHTSQDSL
jgi:amino acid adenylation domain-containing protein